MRQPAWDQYEAALLIETYIRILNNPKSRESYISELSKKLRNRAINNGIQIDDVYRNVNGISSYGFSNGNWYT